MKKKLYILAPLLIILSCGGNTQAEKTDNKVNLSTESINAEADGTSEIVTVTANCDWGVYSGDRSWCTVSPSGGVAGTTDIGVNIERNTSYEERTTSVVFSFGTQEKEVAIYQKGAEKPETDTSIQTPDGYTLVWHDEFDTEPLESGNWRFENWAPGYVNNELQRYVAGGRKDGKKTAYVQDGILHIVAQKHNGEVISARMNTTSDWTCGWFEARINLPKGKGTWPAFWMMPTDQSLGWPACGEIDIMEEVGVNPNYTSSSIHTKSYNHTISTQKTKEIYTKNAEGEFHIYALEWTADQIRSYIDGNHFFTFKNDGQNNVDTWPFNKAFYITLNLAWGGSWGGYAGVDEDALPCDMQVDYVRVFQRVTGAVSWTAPEPR